MLVSSSSVSVRAPFCLFSSVSHQRIYTVLVLVCLRTVQGHGGGIPAQMFQEEPQSDTLRAMELEFQNLSRELHPDARGRHAVDGGSFGAYIDSNSEFHAEELLFDRLQTKDPLSAHPVLQKVRDHFIQDSPPDVSSCFEKDTPIHNITDYQRHGKTVQMYLFYKQVNQELLQCALYYSSISDTGGPQYDWVNFVRTAPDESEGVRSGLARTVVDHMSS